MRPVSPAHQTNLVMKYMKLPMTVANMLGMCVPSSDTSQVVLLYMTLTIFLAYVFSIILEAADKNLDFIGVVESVGDIARAIVLPIFQAEMCKNGERLMEGINKASAVEENLNGLFRDPKKPTSQTPIATRLILRVILQSASFASGLLAQCGGFSLSYLVSYILMNYISLFFFVGWTILIAFLRLVDDQFQFLITRLNDESHSHAPRQQIWEEYRQSIKLHSQLCWAVDEVMKWFQRAFLAFACYYFYTASINLYLISRRVFRLMAQPTWCTSMELINLFLWLSIRSQEMWSIVTCCVATEKRSRNFTDRLHEVIKNYSDFPVEGILKLHFLVKPRVDFWAYGFFKIDNTLLYSMVGASATYLAVVYQSVNLELPQARNTTE